MAENKKLVIFGDGEFAELVCEYFTHDSPYDVVAFAVDKDYRQHDELLGKPVVNYEDVVEQYPPDSHELFVAIIYTDMNRLRQKMAERVKADGYKLASYVSSKSFVWHNVTLGEHCFIFEDNTIQPFVTMGDNCILWSGNHIGHHSTIGSHNFISSHVVISGFCTIGDHCFFGVNATIGDALTIGSRCWVGQGSMVTKMVPDESLVKATHLSDVVKLDIEKMNAHLEKVKAGRL